MRNLLLFVDGAVHAALWTTGPLLLPSLISHNVKQRPFSAEEALTMTGTVPRMDGNNTNIIATTGGVGEVISMMNHDPFKNPHPLPIYSMVPMLLVFLVGRALGCHVMDRRYGIHSRLILLVRRLPCCTMPMRNTPSWRVACLAVSVMISLLVLNWGLGIFTLGGWMAIRFITAVISGGIMTWGKNMIEKKDHSSSVVGYKEKDDCGDGEQQIMMEEGQALLSTTFSGEKEEGELGSIQSQQHFTENKKWLDWYWLAGVATSAFVGGSLLFYPLNGLMVAFHPHERTYVFVLVIGLGGVVDRCLFRYYSKNRPSTHLLTAASSRSFSDAGIVGGEKVGTTLQIPKNDDRNMPSVSRSSSSAQRRKQVHQKAQRQSTFDEDEEQQQISFFDNQMETPKRQRTNSNDTFESEQFFDCLDDIGLDSEHNTMGTATSSQTAPTRSYNNQIAVYSGRKVIYPDGSPAHIPAGESLSNTPSGYLALYKNDVSKSQSKYLLTQQWRHKEQICSIHARPHTWFPKIKVAYPHVIHGFTTNGMLVVYESPGRMNLKHLFRNGCSVEDMTFHYCYLMEYLSNLESILTELHSNDPDNDGDDDEWQDELAAYAHAKQSRLQSDSVSFGFCVVMDISGANPTSLSGDVVTYLKRAGEINSLHYPGSMRRAIAVQAPFWIGVAWRGIKGAMPASVTVDLLSGAQIMEGGLKQYIDESSIPLEYGGKSKFKLGEHPFELGLKKLVERQGELVDGLGSGYEEKSLEIPGADSPLYDSTPVYFSPSPPLEWDVKLEQDSPTSFAEESTMSREWDGLAHENILMVAEILHFFVNVVVGSLELALPYWIISPPIYGGMGYEPRRNGMAVFASCFIISWATKRSRVSQLTRSTIEKSPLRGFRIGIGTICFVLLCASLIPTTSDPSKSTIGLACFSAYLSFIFFGGIFAIQSLEHLRGVVRSSREEGNAGWMQNSKSTSAMSAIGRAVGYICVAPIYRWSIQKELSFPLNASFFMCLLACICWLLYIVSFSLHTAAPSPPNSHTKRKESQFMSAMVGWFSFAKEVLLVAFGDVTFLVNELSKGDSRRV